MTPEEHQLVIEMFKQQTLYYAALVEALKSRGILDRGDLQAFDDFVSASSREALERNVKAHYLEQCKVLGVTTGLSLEDGF
jgi:hypothetical protein